MDKKELYKLLIVKESQFEKAKTRRLIKTILAFSLVFFLLFCRIERPSGLDCIGYAFMSVFFQESMF